MRRAKALLLLALVIGCGSDAAAEKKLLLY